MTLVQGVEPKPPVPVAPGESGPTAPSAPAKDPDVPDSPEGQRPESEKPTDQLLLEVGGILLPPGTLQVEPAVEYTYSDSDQVGINGFTIFEAIVIGNISVDDVERNIIRSSVTTRLGVYDRLQIDAFVPYIYRQDRLTDSVGTDNVREENTDGHGIGDVQFGVSYQPIIGQGAIPDLILRTRASFPRSSIAPSSTSVRTAWCMPSLRSISMLNEMPTFSINPARSAPLPLRRTAKRRKCKLIL